MNFVLLYSPFAPETDLSNSLSSSSHQFSCSQMLRSQSISKGNTPLSAWQYCRSARETLRLHKNIIFKPKLNNLLPRQSCQNAKVLNKLLKTAETYLLLTGVVFEVKRDSLFQLLSLFHPSGFGLDLYTSNIHTPLVRTSLVN